jgi:hypothetical protein
MRWSNDARALFYLALDGRVMALTVDTNKADCRARRVPPLRSFDIPPLPTTPMAMPAGRA